MKIRLSQLRQIIKEEIQRSQASNLQEFGYAQKYLKRRARPEVKAKPLPEPEKSKSYAMKLPADAYGSDEVEDEDEGPITIGIPLTMLDDNYFDDEIGSDISNDPKVYNLTPKDDDDDDDNAANRPTTVILGGLYKETKKHIVYATFDGLEGAREWFIATTEDKTDDAFDDAMMHHADAENAIAAAKAAAKAAATATTTESIKRLRRLIRGYT